ncbi:MAG: cytochrome c-type biogenesis protein CcmH [Rhodocyclaceae bacterium]|nr:cytochrome c-type biogenesis protein CcmH [Rhodocyclaceae bacterium]
MRAILYLTLLLGFMLSAPVRAGEAKPMAADPATEARMLSISKELRCLVCQNETLADSRASLAEDLRVEVRQLVKENKTDQEIKDYLVARYGDFVLYRPPMEPTTWLLWFGPFALLAGGVAGLALFLKRRSASVPEEKLSDEERARAEALLREPGDKA